MIAGPLTSGDGRRTEYAGVGVAAKKGAIVDRDERELELEDAYFVEISDEEDAQATAESALLDEDEDEFVQGSVDVEDLATGFSDTIPTREVDVDADTQGDEVSAMGEDELLTEYEVTGDAPERVRGDEIQLDLDDALATGRTVAPAPD